MTTSSYVISQNSHENLDSNGWIVTPVSKGSCQMHCSDYQTLWICPPITKYLDFLSNANVLCHYSTWFRQKGYQYLNHVQELKKFLSYNFLSNSLSLRNIETNKSLFTFSYKFPTYSGEKYKVVSQAPLFNKLRSSVHMTITVHRNRHSSTHRCHYYNWKRKQSIESGHSCVTQMLIFCIIFYKMKHSKKVASIALIHYKFLVSDLWLHKIFVLINHK